MRRSRRRDEEEPLDAELAELPEGARWREWLLRVEAALFAAPTPVPREMLARLVGKDCRIDALLEDLKAELRARPYDLVCVAGGWRLSPSRASRGRSAPRTRTRCATPARRSSPRPSCSP